MRLFYAVAVAALLSFTSAAAFAQSSSIAAPAAEDISPAETSQGEVHGVLGGSDVADAKSPAALAAQIKSAPVMTPQQAQQNWRPAYRLPQQYQQQVNAMTPAQRQDIVKQAYKNWNTMNTADKTKLRSLAVSQFEALPADDQHELEQQALDEWRSMSPDEQQDMKDSFGLEGDLDLTGSGFSSQ